MPMPPPVRDPVTMLAEVRAASAYHRHGIPLGTGLEGGPALFAPPERSVLALGPSRSGKTSSLVVPAVLSACGPVISTSTKPDIAATTARARALAGTCWMFDPTGSSSAFAERWGLRPLRWSPAEAAASWEASLGVAAALAHAARPRRGFENASHWNERAEALVAPLVWAAHLSGQGMELVNTTVLSRDATRAAAILGQAPDSMAARVLGGILATEEREQSGIFSTAAGILSAYRSEIALAQAARPNFDPAEFVHSGDTIYIASGVDDQARAAPLVVSLLEEIRRHAYRRAAQPELTATPAERPACAPVLFALDEVAHTAPLPSLPSLVAEGGGQGALTVACLQDLSQAGDHFGRHSGQELLNLFPVKVVFPGIVDRPTLEALSIVGGEVDVETRSVSRAAPVRFPFLTGSRHRRPLPTVTVATRRQRVLPPDVITRGREGCALVVDGARPPGYARLQPWYATPGLRELAGIGRTPEPERPAGRAVSPREPGRGMAFGM